MRRSVVLGSFAGVFLVPSGRSCPPYLKESFPGFLLSFFSLLGFVVIILLLLLSVSLFGLFISTGPLGFCVTGVIGGLHWGLVAGLWVVRVTRGSSALGCDCGCSPLAPGHPTSICDLGVNSDFCRISKNCFLSISDLLHLPISFLIFLCSYNTCFARKP